MSSQRRTNGSAYEGSYLVTIVPTDDAAVGSTVSPTINTAQLATLAVADDAAHTSTK